MTDYPHTATYKASWQEITLLTAQLCASIEVAIPPRKLQTYTLAGVRRGGLIPGVIASHRLSLSMIEMSPQPFRSRPTPTHFPLIIIDDICDQGHTFQNLKVVFPDALYCALYVKPLGTTLCDIAIRPIPQDTWVVFPWEKDPADAGL